MGNDFKVSVWGMHTDKHIDGVSGWVSVIQGRGEEEWEMDCRGGKGEKKKSEREKEGEGEYFILFNQSYFET